MNRRPLLSFLLPAVLLAACAQKAAVPTTQDQPTAKLYTKLGLVQSFKGSKSSGVSARFSSIAAAALPEAQNNSTLDTCQLGSALEPFGQLLSPITNVLSGPLDAGEALTFKKNGMAFVNVPRMNQVPQATGTTGRYQADNLVLGGLSNLTLSIPGAAGGFPALSDVPFPVPNPAFSLTAPADLTSITPVTAFTWTGASNDPAAAVLIGVKQGDLAFFCSARDDGSFTIPSDFQDVLKAQKFTKGTAGVLQSLTQLKTSGDALLVLQSLSSVGDF